MTGPGIDAGTVASIDRYEIDVYLRCGDVSASWDGLPTGDLIAETNGGSSACFPGDAAFSDVEPAWVRSAATFTLDGPRRRILDPASGVTAILSPAPPNPVDPSGAAEPMYPPRSASPVERAELDEAAPALPAHLAPAASEDLIGGTWMLRDRQGFAAPDLAFEADGTYHGSDGCNGMGGRWRVLNGALLFTKGGMTLIGCDNINLLDGVRSAGMDHDQLVLLDASGAVQHRLVRVPIPGRAGA